MLTKRVEIKMTGNYGHLDVILRCEEGLHCRFCKDNISLGTKLYETLYFKGIVCEDCLEHLKAYTHIKIVHKIGAKNE